MPKDIVVLTNALVRNVNFTAEHLSIVRQQRSDVQRRETDLFDPAQSKRNMEQAIIPDLFVRENALRYPRVSEHIDPADLARRLLAKLTKSFENASEDVPEQKVLRRSVNVLLVRTPRLCRDALPELRQPIRRQVHGIIRHPGIPLCETLSNQA
jgi:hypothetical protein